MCYDMLRGYTGRCITTCSPATLADVLRHAPRLHLQMYYDMLPGYTGRCITTCSPATPADVSQHAPWLHRQMCYDMLPGYTGRCITTCSLATPADVLRHAPWPPVTDVWGVGWGGGWGAGGTDIISATWKGNLQTEVSCMYKSTDRTSTFEVKYIWTSTFEHWWDRTYSAVTNTMWEAGGLASSHHQLVRSKYDIGQFGLQLCIRQW